MSKGKQLTSLVTSFTLLIASLSCQSSAQSAPSVSMSGEPLKVSKIEFPQPWLETNGGGHQTPVLFPEQMEVRVPNSPSGELFFAALPNGDADYASELNKDIPKPKYSENFFAVNLANGNRVRTLTKSEWSSASRILTKPRSVFSKGPNGSGEMEYRGKTFPKIGKHWDHGMLSPHGKWLAVFGYTGVKQTPLLPFLGGDDPRTGDIFWTIYDAESGEKVFQWEAKDVESPASLGHPVVWLEERHLLFPLDVHAQKFTVVTLPEFASKQTPVTLKLPPRQDENGRRIPAYKFHEAWTPLAPLTKEQAAAKVAPMPTELTEVRLSASASPRELLIEVLEETENRNRVARYTDGYRQGDGAGEYHFRVLGKYYYAVSLENPTQTRFASKQEWDRGRSLRTDHSLLSLDEKVPTTWGDRPAYHPVTKRGATWCNPKALRANEWIAAFSYTRAPRSGGEMFIDVYDNSSGFKMSSGESSYEGDANELLKKAFWIEGDYLLIPLDSSFNSFLFWTLPGFSARPSF